MKKSIPLIVISVIVLAILIAIIMYMKPNTTTVEPTPPQETTSNNTVNVVDNNEEVAAEPPPEPVIPTENNTTVAEGEVDFNAEVYGNSLPQGADTVNEDGTITPAEGNFLSDTASDPQVTPIAPEDDPANQIYSLPPEEDAE